MNGFEIPLMGMATGIIIPVAVFVWLYFEEKGKRDTMLEIAKHIDDPRQLEQLVSIFKEKKEPIDYRRGGIIKVHARECFCRFHNSNGGEERRAAGLASRRGASVARDHRGGRHCPMFATAAEPDFYRLGFLAGGRRRRKVPRSNNARPAQALDQ